MAGSFQEVLFEEKGEKKKGEISLEEHVEGNNNATSYRKRALVLVDVTRKQICG